VIARSEIEWSFEPQTPEQNTKVMIEYWVMPKKISKFWQNF
jgi:hypothetical protein